MKVADSFLSEPKRGCASWWVLFSGDRAENEIEMTKQKIRNFLRSQAARQAGFGAENVTYAVSPLLSGYGGEFFPCALLLRVAATMMGRFSC